MIQYSVGYGVNEGDKSVSFYAFIQNVFPQRLISIYQTRQWFKMKNQELKLTFLLHDGLVGEEGLLLAS